MVAALPPKIGLATKLLTVSDTGPGVPADALPHIFEPFFSLKAKGTGLGLAIAKRTIDAHGGRIVATSPAGSGLAVHIELPLAAQIPAHRTQSTD